MRINKKIVLVPLTGCGFVLKFRYEFEQGDQVIKLNVMKVKTLWNQI